ncbi:hypothetical protein [Polymorphospora sp. NPDC050346]|uniref:hypothetical protein n=1 Tax=Polymorphospora sp. NPDC050346 TaxID=3155780 RepID=UPI0033C3D2BA
MVTDPASIYVQDHGFFLADREASTPLETMDYSTGLAGVMESAALIHAGIDRGYVAVTAQALEHPVGLDTAEQWADIDSWDDVAEISLYVPNASLSVEQLTYGPSDPRPLLPGLSPYGPGHYRVRIHASGRDRHYDQVIDQSGERFHFLAWPAPPAAPLVIKATSRCGYGLRLNALRAPRRPEPVPPSSAQQAEAQRQALLRRNLLSR